VIAPRPFLHWAGGKHGLMDQLRPLRPAYFRRYHERFLGSGAMFWDIAASGFTGPAFLSDANPDLILTYKVVRDEVEGLIGALDRLINIGVDEETYYSVRREFNERSGPNLWQAARFIYLNKVGYKGLFRVNLSGMNNTPYGWIKSPSVYEHEVLRSCSYALQGATIACEDWSGVIEDAEHEDFFYADPPYDGDNFTSYTADRFNRLRQESLANGFRYLVGGGVRCMMSNSDTQGVRLMYGQHQIDTVTRSGGMKGKGRAPVQELVIRGGYS
jgi:DNA adenine methylase